MTQRGHAFAIVDEVDSILVDEARTPLIISGPTEDQTRNLPRGRRADGRASSKRRLRTGRKAAPGHADRKRQRAYGRAAARQPACLSNGDLYDTENITIVHHVNQALKAHMLFQKDKDYIVKNDQVDHHRRIHRPHDGRPPLFRRPAPGAGSQGTCRRSSRRTSPWPRSPSRIISASMTSWPA